MFLVIFGCSTLLNTSWKCIPPRVCAKTLDAILNYWFFVYLWKETKQYIYKLHSRRKQKIKFK